MGETDRRFDEWLSCPECSSDTDIGILTHSTDIVLECYDCGATSEYTIGADVPVTNLDTTAIEQFAEDG